MRIWKLCEVIISVTQRAIMKIRPARKSKGFVIDVIVARSRELCFAMRCWSSLHAALKMKRESSRIKPGSRCRMLKRSKDVKKRAVAYEISVSDENTSRMSMKRAAPL
jgi:hypothetical protein